MGLSQCINIRLTRSDLEQRGKIPPIYSCRMDGRQILNAVIDHPAEFGIGLVGQFVKGLCGVVASWLEPCRHFRIARSLTFVALLEVCHASSRPIRLCTLSMFFYSAHVLSLLFRVLVQLYSKLGTVVPECIAAKTSCSFLCVVRCLGDLLR